MTFPFRPSTPRPDLVSDPWSFWLYDPTTKTVVGRPAPLSRNRLVSAIPLKDGPHQIVPDRVVVDPWGFVLIDPLTFSAIGQPGLRINRLLSAGWSQDTRGLG